MWSRSQVSAAFAFGVLLTVGGCSGPTSLPAIFPQLGKLTEEPPPEAKKESQEAPPCKGAEKCAAHLRKLVSNPKRDWVGQKHGPDAYTDGTRLFAYRALKPKLTCSELARAYTETREAAPALKGETHAATRKLMAEVSNELRAERLKRCKTAAAKS